ncbi:MAG TPA: hypothetical protein VLY24_06355 [Bryobacteraceae bacterium]|nr:hypothetical protein [Bryobacteraceae bacterium]
MGTFDRLMKLANMYHREVRRCLKGKAYLGATIMEVSALEAALQAMCLLYWQDVKKTNVCKGKRFRRKRNLALDFSLNQLIEIAAELSWFPPKRVTWAGKRTTIAGFTHEARKVRNLVHPGEYGRKEWERFTVTKGVHGVVDEICDVATSHLRYRVEQQLLQRMNRDAKKRTTQ